MSGSCCFGDVPMFLVFIKAAAVGAAIAAPVGPMALLCIRRTIAHGWRAGFAVGAGIATGDMFLAIVPAAGLTSFSRLLLTHERLMHLAAAPVLIYLGVRALTAPTAEERLDGPASHAGAYTNSAALTLANPPTLITFAALFAAVAPATAPRFAGAAATIAGIATGSLTWWIVLISAVTLARKSFTPKIRRLITILAAVALVAFGALQLVSAMRS